MTELVFGEIKVPYDNKTGTADTVAVAKILEAKYGLFSAFYTRHENDIKALLIDSLAGALENLHMGAPLPANPFEGSMAKLQALFKKFLYTQEVEQMGIPGVPTKAALDGVSHRKKKKTYGHRRPSFIDSGTMELAFRSWMEGFMQ
jgi:hypothetical protein